MSERVNKVAVMGSGSWGTAMAGLLAERSRDVALWCRDAALAEAVSATRKNPRMSLTEPEAFVSVPQ